MFAGDRTRGGGEGTRRTCARGRLACAVALALVTLLAASPGCSSEGSNGTGTGTSSGGGAGGAGGTQAGVGGPEAPCLDIWVHSGILDEPLKSGAAAVAWPRQPFWRDERGLHVAWPHSEITDGAARPVHLVVSTFDPVSGDVLVHRLYDPWPPEVKMGGMSVFGFAASLDGSFAATIGYGDDGAPDGYAVKLVLGHLDQEGSLHEWLPPWSILDWHPFHVGWDGEAFVFDFVTNSVSDVLMLRLAPNGSEVLPPTEVGSITSIEDYASSFHTDPDTGTTWLATSHADGVWLSGHQRDGSPLPGTEPDGAVVIAAQGGPTMGTPSRHLAAASDGQSVLLSWSSNARATAYLQRAEGGNAVGDAVVLLDSSETIGPWLGPKQLRRLDDGWWMSGAVASSDPAELGTQSFWFPGTSGQDVVSRTMLLGGPPCWPGCDNFSFDIRYFASLRYQDEIWFGFKDLTSFSGPIEPYRIVRVGRSCRYQTHYEIQTEQ